MDSLMILLNEKEQTLLEVYERTIERGLKTFYEVGEALAAIRDQRLYRTDYRTFGDYVEDKWGRQYGWAKRLIDASLAVRNIQPSESQLSSPVGEVNHIEHSCEPPIMPSSEYQVRPLTALEPEQQAEAWERAVELASDERKPLTHSHVRQAVDEVRVQGQELEQALAEAGPEAGAATPNILHSSKSNEWYTPASYIEAARSVMGSIELDPASNEFANRLVAANQYFSEAEDGLTRDWFGNIFLNPPYGQRGGKSNQAIWTAKLLGAYRAQQISQAILLVNAVPGNKWFAPLWEFPVCFPNHRIKFYNRQGVPTAPTHSSAIVYLGPHLEKFATAFAQFGIVAVRYKATQGAQ